MTDDVERNESALACPACQARTVGVGDSRPSGDGVIRRRRRCFSCGHKWTTLEIQADTLSPLHMRAVRLLDDLAAPDRDLIFALATRFARNIGGLFMGDISLTDQIRGVEREINMRLKTYPRRVERRQMTQAEADRQIAVMRAVLATLEQLKGATPVEAPAHEAEARP